MRNNTLTTVINIYKYIIMLKILLLLLLVLIGCRNDDIINTQNYTFEKIDSITFEPLTSVNIHSMCVKYFKEGDQEYMLWGNRPQNSIEIFDIGTGNHLKTLKFPREGPNSISRIVGGFSILSMDSIFVSSFDLGKIYICDSSGIVRKVINHSDTSYFSANNLVGLNTKLHSDIFRRRGKLIIPFETANFPTKPTYSLIYSMQVVKLLDLRNQKIYNSGLHFDPDIYEPLSLFLGISNAMLGNRYYFQIATQTDVRYTDNFLIKSKKPAPSKFQTDYVKMRDYPDITEYVTREFAYRSLIADPFRQVIYRTVKLPVKDILTADLDKEFEDVYERVSIMILDKDLNILGEQLFENSNYSWNECFVGEKGLYILRSPYHPNYFEPRITYDIYELKHTINQNMSL